MNYSCSHIGGGVLIVQGHEVRHKFVQLAAGFRYHHKARANQNMFSSKGIIGRSRNTHECLASSSACVCRRGTRQLALLGFVCIEVPCLREDTAIALGIYGHSLTSDWGVVGSCIPACWLHCLEAKRCSFPVSEDVRGGV